MKVRYIFPLERPMQVDDHWPVPLLGGTCRLVEENGLATAVEFERSGMPTGLSLRIDPTPDGLAVAGIHGQDGFLPQVRDHLRRAFSYLQCFFDTAISVDAVKIHYEPEDDAERDEIAIPWFEMKKRERSPLPLSYDMLTRALMAADERGLEFTASLAGMAREAFGAKRYIDSFRFSFLLIEALHGGGRFKSRQLEDAFLAAAELTDAVRLAISQWAEHRIEHASETSRLMAGTPSVEQVVKHLVSMRGHYFHGNVDKKGAWHPGKQDEAEALAWLGIDIAQKIAADAAAPLFSDAFAARHFEQAGQAGAHVVMRIEYRFRLPEDEFIRRHEIDFRMPGTRPTTRMATEAAQRSIENFRDQLPVGRLHSVFGRDLATGERLFEIRILTEPDGTVVNDGIG